MLILKKLRFKGIGRFVEEQTVNFEQLGSLVQVDGKNNNTGGSSGAGKSTVFNALDFLFGLNSVPNNVLQSRLTEETISVEADFDFDGQSLTISRGKKLKIVLGDEVTTGSSKLTEERLDEIIAVPRHLFRPMLHKKQGERGFFLSFTPKETSEFLTDSLGLSIFKKHISNLDAKLLNLSQMIGTLTSNFESAKSGLEATKSALASLGYRPKPTVDRDVIVRLKKKSNFSEQSLKNLLDLQESEVKTLIRPELTHIEFDSSAANRIQAELDSIANEIKFLETEEHNRLHRVQTETYESKEKLSELETKVKYAILAKEEATKLALEVKKLRENFCPTCEQVWTTESARQKEQQLLAKIQELKLSINKIQEFESEISARKDKLALLKLEGVPLRVGEELRAKRIPLNYLMDEEKKKQGNHYSLQAQANKAKQETFNIQYSHLMAKHKRELDPAKGQAELDRKSLERAVMELRMYEDSLKRYESSEKQLKEQEESYQKKVSEALVSVESAKIEEEYYQELKRAIKVYLSCSFDEALETISENATKLVRNIPTMANATLQLSGVRETKEGKVKEEVNAILSTEGDENIDIRSLSGGERSAIDLAIDLSVIELIESKTNKGINIFILDEGFTGMDTTGIEMALEVLKNFGYNKKLIIVEHNPEIKQMVESTLLVQRDGLTSKVIQN